jgi:hypothetical protein
MLTSDSIVAVSTSLSVPGRPYPYIGPRSSVSRSLIRAMPSVWRCPRFVPRTGVERRQLLIDAAWRWLLLLERERTFASNGLDMVLGDCRGFRICRGVAIGFAARFPGTQRGAGSDRAGPAPSTL